MDEKNTMKMILEGLFEANELLIKWLDQLTAIAVEKLKPEPESEKTEAVQAANDEPLEKPKVPVHSSQEGEKFAICGCMGTTSQPFVARMNEPITTLADEVTCPECLKILAEWGES